MAVLVVTEIPIMNQTRSLIHFVIAAVVKVCLNTFSSVCESGETMFIPSYLWAYNKPQLFTVVPRTLSACLLFWRCSRGLAPLSCHPPRRDVRPLHLRPFHLCHNTAPPDLPSVFKGADGTSSYRRGQRCSFKGNQHTWCLVWGCLCRGLCERRPGLRGAWQDRAELTPQQAHSSPAPMLVVPVIIFWRKRKTSHGSEMWGEKKCEKQLCGQQGQRRRKGKRCSPPLQLGLPPGLWGDHSRAAGPEGEQPAGTAPGAVAEGSC